MASVVEEPYDCIKHLLTTNDNYQIARTILQDKYYKHRKIVFNLIDKLLNLDPISKPTEANYNKLAKTVKGILLQLENLKINTTTWDPILVRLITSKLDKNTSEKWSFTLKKDEIPSIDSVLNYIVKKRSGRPAMDN